MTHSLLVLIIMCHDQGQVLARSTLHTSFIFPFPLCIDPHSPPREVQSVVTGSRTAIITWQPPALEHQNGPITYYVVVVRDLQFNESDLIINVTSITANLTALEEYDTYSFKVAAATGAGLGPYSDAIVFVTQQDGKNVNRCISIRL